MNPSRWQPRSPVVTALLCSTVIGAQYVSGKVVRDTLFLDVFDANTALPWMTQATSVFSILLVFVAAAASKRVPPASYVPIAFGFSAVLLVACWAAVSVAPRSAAVIVYLQVSGLGPVLGSGFWLLTSERLDPRTAKRRFGLIAGAGTLGGLLTTFAPSPSAAALLPVLGGLNILCGALVWVLGRSSAGAGTAPRSTAKAAETNGLRVLAQQSYLQNLAVLVLLGTLGAIVMDYLFKTEVSATFGKNKLAFFKIYYPAVNTITFLLQTFGASIVLDKAGIAAATALPSFTLLGGSIASLIAPGLTSVVAVRGGESVFRGSLYRSGYEVFFTPVPPREKRAVKTTIDVGFDRFGDLIGAVFMQLALLLPAGQRTSALLLVVGGCSGAGLVIARGLKRGYQQALEHSLVVRGEELELPEFEDSATRAVLLKTMAVRSGDTVALGYPTTIGSDTETDRVVESIRALRSNDNEVIRSVLRTAKGPALALVPHIIPLLAWDEIAPECIRALRAVAEERIGTLTDVLVDPNQPFVIRRRLARVFFVCVSQRAADGMLLGLEDGSFEVRFRCGQSLFAIVEKNPGVLIDPNRILAIVEREVAVSTGIWKARGFVDETDAGDTRAFLDEVIRDRANQALEHVFRLLALVLPAKPMQIAFHALHTTNDNLRGTALDYLDTVVPPSIKTPLWPFIEDGAAPVAKRQPRQGDRALAELLQSHASIMLNLKELQKRKASAGIGWVLSLALALVLNAGPVIAQGTRERAIADQQAEKVGSLGIEGPDRAEQTIVRIMNSPLLVGTGGVFPWFGSVYEGTKFAVGAGYLRRMPRSSQLMLIAGVSVNGSTLLRADYTARRFLSDRIEPYASVRWARAKDVSFYGVGNDSVITARTGYDFDPAQLSAGIAFRPHDRMRVTAGYEFIGFETHVVASSLPRTILDSLSNDNRLRFNGTHFGFVFDTRASPAYSTRGTLARVSTSYYSEGHDERFEFRQTEFEAAQFVPLLREQFVLAFRALATITNPDADNSAPLALLPYVGSGTTVRGFVNRRFVDRDRIVLNGEYRWRPSRFIDTAVFLDAGHVAPRANDFALDRLRTSWGIGARFHGPAFSAFRVELARSVEGFHLVFTTGPPF